MVVRPSPKEIAYDYEEIRELRGKGWSWERLGKLYGRDYRNVGRWYGREKERRRPHTTNNALHRNQVKTKNSQHKQSPTKRGNAKHSREISRIYDPIKNPPTGYISELSNDDWILHYFGGDGEVPTGYEWKDLDYLTDMRMKLWHFLLLLVLLPRGHGKTTSIIALFARYLLEVFRPLLCIKAGGMGSRIVFREVRKLLMSHKIRQDYGDIMETMNISTQEMYYCNQIDTSSSDPAFKCVGKGGEIIGLHAGWIHLDDIVQEEAKSEMTKEALKYWYSDVVKYCVVRGDNPTRITATGTRKDPDDFYSYLMASRYEVLHRKSIEPIKGRLPNAEDCVFDERGNLLSIGEVGEYETLECPNWTVLDIFQEMFDDPVGWASQMQNEPIPRSGLFFKQEEWRENDLHLSHFTNNQVFVDPAWGKSAAASETAIIVVSVYNSKLVILDSSIGKYNPVQLEGEAVRLAHKHACMSTHLEDNFIQITSRFNSASKLMQLPGAQTFQQKTDKIMRIDTLKGPFSTGRIEIHTSCSFKDKIKAQFLKYNRRKGSWDILDVISTAYQMNAYYMSEQVTEDWAFKVIG
jgi:hypothetical protein